MIVSASRRCDLPAYRMGWLMERIREGFCEARNPFNPKDARRVSLRPEDLDCLVLWTRDPRPLLRHLDELEGRGIRFYLQLSLTAYPRALEPGSPPPEEILPAMRALAARIGPRRLVWRYDPLILAAGASPEAPSLDREFHLRNVEALSAAVEGSSTRLVLSLLDEYRRTSLRLRRAGYPEPLYGSPLGSAGAGGLPPPRESPASLLRELADLARSRGLEPRSCAEPGLLEASGIEPGACVDADLIEELFGRPPGAAARRAPRPGCRCAPSVDIGDYGSCPAGCVYCYARR